MLNLVVITGAIAAVITNKRMYNARLEREKERIATDTSLRLLEAVSGVRTTLADTINSIEDLRAKVDYHDRSIDARLEYITSRVGIIEEGLQEIKVYSYEQPDKIREIVEHECNKLHTKITFTPLNVCVLNNKLKEV